MTRRFAIGCDLGKARDPSAIIVAETEPARTLGGAALPMIVEVSHLERLPLNTSYVDVKARIAEIAQRLFFVSPTVLVDAGGPGRPIVDDLRVSGTPRIVAVQATGGDAEHCARVFKGQQDWTVSKGRLMRSVSSLVYGGRLRIASTLHLAPDLLRELEDLQSHTTGAGREIIDVADNADHHGDLVSALAMCTWWFQRPQTKTHVELARFQRRM